jgi:Icc-related predicted phosphoesterase
MRILISGDIHGRIGFLDSLSLKIGADAVFQIGDLGLYRDYDSLDVTAKRHFLSDPSQAEIFDYVSKKKQFPVPLFFVRGNHDDFSLLSSLESSPLPNFYLLDSGVHQILDLRVGALGGIYYWGHDSEKRKLLKYTQSDEVAPIVVGKKVDILLSHDAPFCKVFEGMHRHGSPYVSRLIANLDPSLVFYGHYNAVVPPYLIGTTQVYPMTSLPQWAENLGLLHQKEALFGILESRENVLTFSYLN